MRKFLAACYRVFKTPWPLFVYGVLLMVCSVLVFVTSELDSFCVFAVGCAFGIGFDCELDAIIQLIDRKKEK